MIADISILAEGQFAVGDLIEVNGKAAPVEVLTVRSTTLRDSARRGIVRGFVVAQVHRAMQQDMTIEALPGGSAPSATASPDPT